MHKKSLNGRFVIQKPQCTFSRKPNDKSHEQNIKVIKGSKGAIGIFDHVICLAKCEIARVLRKNVCVSMMRTTHNLKKMSKKDFQSQNFRNGVVCSMYGGCACLCKKLLSEECMPKNQIYLYGTTQTFTEVLENLSHIL